MEHWFEVGKGFFFVFSSISYTAPSIFLYEVNFSQYSVTKNHQSQ